jgi:hypothetical protein
MFHFILSALAAAAPPLQVEATITTHAHKPGVEGHAENPLFSPDGKYLSFEVNGLKDTRRLVIGELKGGIVAKSVTPALPGSSAYGKGNQVHVDSMWHPSGLVVFAGSVGQSDFRLFTAYPNGAAPSPLIELKDAPGKHTFPAMTHDGGIVFVSSASGKGDLFSYKDGAVEPLAGSPQTESYPSPAPDGSVVFTRRDDGSNNVYRRDKAGDVTPVAVGDEHFARGIPVGDEVLLFEGDHGVKLVAIGPGGKRVLASGMRAPSRGRAPISPDGMWTAWTMDAAGARHIMLGRIDGSKQVELVVDQSALGDPTFGSTDGRTLLAFTGIEDGGADWRRLSIADITDTLR